MEVEAYGDFEATGVGKNAIKLIRTAELRYVGQFHEVEVELPGGGVTEKQVANIVETFNAMHQKLFQFSMPGHRVEFSTFRLKASTPNAAFSLKKIGVGNADSSHALKRRRACIFSGKRIDTPIYDGGLLLAGNVIDGPAIVEESTTTIVIPEGFRCTLDESKNYVLRDVSATRLN
jgi:N-methylhydantoinase A